MTEPILASCVDTNLFTQINVKTRNSMLCDTQKKQMEMKLQHAHMLTNTHKLFSLYIDGP